MSSATLAASAPAPAAPTPAPTVRATRRPHVLALVLTAGGLCCWGAALVTSEVDDLTDLGLVAALTWPFWVAVGLVTTAFVVALRAPRFTAWTAAPPLLSLIALVYATPAVIERTPRLEATYRHLGIVEQIGSTGSVDRTIDAYFSWPGLFSLASLLQDATSADTLLVVATVAPFAAAVLYLPSLLLLMRSITPTPRLQWLGAAVFYVANWTGQDYLAPQTFSFWIFLSVLGILLAAVTARGRPATGRMARLRRALRLDGGRHRIEHRVRVTERQMAGLLAIVVLAATAVVASHQLTPYLLVVMLSVLWLSGRLRQWWLPILVGAVAVFWLLVPAWPFTSGHLLDTFAGTGATGQPTETVGARMANGSTEHLFVVTARIAQSLGLWLLAAVGAYLVWRRSKGFAAPLLLMMGAFVFVPLQSYGGEMVIRAYLFSLPFAAALVASVLHRWAGPTSRLRGAVLVLALSALLTVTMVTRYGNERGESFRTDELAAMSWVYQQHDQDAAILTVTDNAPWKFHDYADRAHASVESAEPGQPWPDDPTVQDVVALIEEQPSDTVYVVYTRSQAAMAELAGNTGPGTVQRLVEQLTADPRFEVKFAADHATVLRWAG